MSLAEWTPSLAPGGTCRTLPPISAKTHAELQLATLRKVDGSTCPDCFKVRQACSLTPTQPAGMVSYTPAVISRSRKRRPITVDVVPAPPGEWKKIGTFRLPR